jgi:hypothetical protein
MKATPHPLYPRQRTYGCLCGKLVGPLTMSGVSVVKGKVAAPARNGAPILVMQLVF